MTPPSVVPGEALRVGVVGVGVMGADHVRRLATKIAGVRLVAIADPDTDRADDLAAELADGRAGRVRVMADPLELISAEDVDAVVLASPGWTHPEQLLRCLELGKPVLCEKPLTVDSESSLQIVEAERAGGRPLIQVGFMRRFDPEYARLKELLDSGRWGRTLMLHQVHRNRSVPNPDFRSEMIVRDSFVHEVDCARFLLGEEIASVQVIAPAPTSHALPGVLDPQVIIMRSVTGVVATSEVFVNSRTGYEVRCEAVAETGSAIIGRPSSGILTTSVTGDGPGQWGGPIDGDYRTRFERAYDLEVQAWVDATRRGELVGPTAWDGYAATVVCSAAMESLATGLPVDVALG